LVRPESRQGVGDPEQRTPTNSRRPRRLLFAAKGRCSDRLLASGADGLARPDHASRLTARFRFAPSGDGCGGCRPASGQWWNQRVGRPAVGTENTMAECGSSQDAHSTTAAGVVSTTTPTAASAAPSSFRSRRSSADTNTGPPSRRENSRRRGSGTGHPPRPQQPLAQLPQLIRPRHQVGRPPPRDVERQRPR